MRDFNVKTSAPDEDRLETVLHFVGDTFPRVFVINRLDREVDYVTVDGERYERVSECENTNTDGYGLRFECSECGYSAIVHNCAARFDELPNYCPNCGARVKEVGA